MNITTGSCTLIKDDSNLVGISIGGGAPICPCVYIVQVFDRSPASREGSLAAGKLTNYLISDYLLSIINKATRSSESITNQSKARPKSKWPK